jgi:ParB family chromosome partitioning protein
MNLKDKASRIKFPLDNHPASPTTTDGAESKTKTAPGAMMAFANDRRSEMLKENDELKRKVASVDLIQARLDETLNELRQWDGAKGVRELNPQQIVRSKFANRHEHNFKGADFDLLKNEIASAGGNIQPIKVRPIKDKSGTVLYEIVFGHRRHEACRQLGIPVHAIVDNLDDLSLFVEMERENRGREDLSAWEQGVAYKRALSSGLISSQRELASVIGVDQSNVTKALQVANLPDEVVGAFTSPTSITFRWGKELSEACKANKEEVIARANAIASENLPDEKVFKTLIGASVPERAAPNTAFEIDGREGAFAKVEETKAGAVVVKFSTTLSDQKLVKLKAFLNELSLHED